MAVSPVVPNAVQVRLLWMIGGEVAINVLNTNTPPGVVVNQALANTIGAALKSSFTTNWAPHCATTSQLMNVGLRDLRVANQLEFKDTGAAVSGSGGSGQLPSGNAVCVTLRTAKSGKSFRGRIYLPGAATPEVASGGTQTTAINTAAVAFVTDIANRLAAQQMTLGVMSRPAEAYQIVKTTTHSDGSTTVKRISNVSAKTGGLENVVSWDTRNTRWEYQRRRQNGRTTTAQSFGAPIAVGYAAGQGVAAPSV